MEVRSVGARRVTRNVGGKNHESGERFEVILPRDREAHGRGLRVGQPQHGTAACSALLVIAGEVPGIHRGNSVFRRLSASASAWAAPSSLKGPRLKYSLAFTPTMQSTAQNL